MKLSSLKPLIPQEIYEVLEKENIIAFIRAFADDESCVTTSAIVYVQKDKETLENIRKLYLIVGFDKKYLTEVKSKGNLYEFSIKGKGLFYFSKRIGYKHPDKEKDLKTEIKRKINKRSITTVDMTKKQITNFLNKPRTIKQLSEKK